MGVSADGPNSPITGGVPPGGPGAEIPTVRATEAAIVRNVARQVRRTANLAFRAAVLTSIHEAVLATDADLLLTYWNEPAADLFGWPANEILGQPLSVLWPETALGQAQAAVGAVRETGHWHGEVVRQRRDGTIFDAELSIAALRSVDGAFAGLVAVVQDITDRKQAERYRLRLAAVHELESAIVAGADPDILADLAARAARRLTGAGLAAVGRIDPATGNVLTIAVDGESDSVRAGDRRPWSIAFEPLRRGEPLTLGDLRDVADRSPSAAVLAAEGWRTSVNVPMLLDGEFMGLLSVNWREPGAASAETVEQAQAVATTLALGFRQAGVRATERKAQEETARAIERLGLLHEISSSALGTTSFEELGREVLPIVRRTTDAVRVALSVIEHDRSMARLVALDVSPSAMKPGDRYALRADLLPLGGVGRVRGLDVGDRFGLRADLLPPLEAGQLHEIPDLEPLRGTADVFDLLLAGGVRAIVTVPLRAEAVLIGLLGVSWAGVHPIDDALRQRLGDVAGVVALALRQTMLQEQNTALLADLRRRAAELEDRVAARTAELTEINADLEAFSYSVSHDLRAPVRGMRGFAEAIVEDEGERLTILGRGYANRIIAAADRMDMLIDDLLNYARLSRATLPLATVNLDRVVSEAIAQLEATIRASGAKVGRPRHLGAVRGHRQTLVQIVANLISNGLTYVRQGVSPVIEVQAEQRDGRLRVWVVDNGLGIAPEHFERIFRPFERLHGMDAYPGTGLGLAIVRRGLERMGGTCGVESEPGVGSRFWIELPVAES